MKECRKRQIELERNYINSEYFNNINTLSNLVKIDNRCSSCDVLLNNKPYVLYKYELNGMRLIPKVNDLFKGDFDDIYEYHYIKDHGILFTILSKQNGIISEQYYLCTMNDNHEYKDYMSVKYIYSTIVDKNNELYKKYVEEKVSEELFLVRRGYSRLGLAKTENVVELKKYDNGICDKREYNVFNGITYNIKLGRIDLLDDSSLLYTIANLYAKKISR